MAFRYSNFPQSLDKLKRLPEYQELSDEDKSYIARYTELCQKGANMTLEDKMEFNDLLTNKLRDKMIQSIDWNLMADAITNMEDFYLNHILKDISDLVNTKEKEFSDYIDKKTDTINKYTSDKMEGVDNYVDSKTSEMLNYVNKKTNEINTYIDTNTTQLNNYIAETTNSMNQKLNEFSYKGEYNANTNYDIWNTVTFKDDTYLCKQSCKNILPTDINYWSRIARHGESIKWRGTWSPVITYNSLDIVLYDDSIFICILANYNKIPTVNQSGNNEYWALIFTNKSDNVNQYYKNFKDSRVVIEHNTESFPEVQAISQSTYGHGGYGLFELYNNYQLHTEVEYINKNTIRLYFVERFNGIPNVTKVTEKEYIIKYSLEDTEIHIYLK